MAVLDKKLEASSLIEVVVAAVIILASFTIAMSVLAKTAGENDVLHRIELNCVVNELMDKQRIGEMEKRAVQIQSSIDKTGDILSVQKVMGKKKENGTQKKIFVRRRLIETGK